MLSAFVLAVMLAPQTLPPPHIVIAGGPTLLWPQIVREYGRRYPAQPADWRFGDTTSDAADLVFAYYPTADQLKPTLTWSARRWLGFPVEFVADAWKRDPEREASARASEYLDEGGVENGVRLLAYLYSLVRDGATTVEPPSKGP